MVELEAIGPVFRSNRRRHPQRLAYRASRVPPLAEASPLDGDAYAHSEGDGETLRAFDKAGWYLPPFSRLAPSIESFEDIEARRVGYLVRKKTDQRLAILQWRLVVQFATGVTRTQVLDTLEQRGLREVRRLRFAEGLYEVEISRPSGLPDQVTPAKAAELQALDEVVFSQPTLIEYFPHRCEPARPLAHRSADPLNPDLHKQWQWEFLRTKDLWFGEGLDGSGRTIAVIDKGFQAKHKDLVDNVDTERSASFDENGLLSPGVDKFRELRHGTMCAGMAAARLNNRCGGCGAAPKASLLLMALASHGVVSQVRLARAIAYAARPWVEGAAGDVPGADVITCSLGPPQASLQRLRVLELAIDFAVHSGRPNPGTNRNLGCPVFWATANNNHRIPSYAVAGYEHVIAVGALDRYGHRAPGGFGAANIGADSELLAPGIGVRTTIPGHGEATDRGGSSLAAPCAAGVAALLITADETLAWTEVKQLLLNSTRAIDVPNPIFDRRGGGPARIHSIRLNAKDALDALRRPRS